MAQIDVTKLSPVDIGDGAVLGVKGGGVALLNTSSLVPQTLRDDVAASTKKTELANTNGSGATLLTAIGEGTGAVVMTQAQKNKETVTPYTFGAVGDGVADDTLAIEKFFARSVIAPSLNYVAVGEFKIIRPIVADYGNKQCSMRWAGSLKSGIPDAVTVLTINNSPNNILSGFLHIFGNGGTGYASRKNTTALVVNNCTRFSFDVIRTDYFLSHAVMFTGTTSQFSGKYLQTWYSGACLAGGDATGWNTTVANVGTQESTSGSSTQKQTLSLSVNLPTYVNTTDWFLRIRGDLYRIQELTNQSTIKIFPWLSSAVVATDKVELVGGAGLYSIGGDVSCGRIETLDALVCGISLQTLSLYPASIGNFVSQYAGVTAMYGSAVGSALTSSTYGYLYSENDIYGIVLGALASIQLDIGPTVSFPFDRSFRMAPRLSNNTFSNAFVSLGPAFSFTNENGVVRGTSMIPAGEDYSNQAVFFEGAGNSSYTIGQATTQISLPDPISINRMTGARAIEIVVFGTGPNTSHTSNLTFVPKATHSINGGAAGANFVVSGLSKPAIFKIMWSGGSVGWRIAWFDAAGGTVKGTTAQRPTLATMDMGRLYLDTTLAVAGKPIWWNSTAWVDAAGIIV